MTKPEEQATVFLCGECYGPDDGRWGLGTVAGVSAECARCKRGIAEEAFQVECQDPRLAEFTPYVEFSTSIDLMLWPSIVWDVNGYYSALGIRPDATRAEIAAAYMALGGEASDRLTYIVSQLLNSEIRRDYDQMPMGSTFWDRFEEEAERARLMERIQRHLESITDDYERDDFLMEVEDVLERVAQDYRSSPLDEDEGEGYNSPSWGYYLWCTSRRDAHAIQIWMRALAQAHRGASRLSVGLMHHSMQDPFMIKTIGYRTVVFLRETESPDRWAKEAVRVLQTTIN